MPETEFRTLSDFIRRTMEQHHIAGAAVSIRQDAQPVYEQCFGVRDLESGAPITPDTVFGFASVSKSFVAMAIMQLAERGLLCVDDPVTKYLPTFRIRGIDDMTDVKIHHLLSHTTGLPPFKRRAGEFEELSQHLEYIAQADYRILGKPGEYHSYCNDSFIMLGAIIEALTGKLFSDYIQQNIFDPLQMKRSTYGEVDGPPYAPDITTLYNYDFETGAHQAQPWPHLASHHVSGGIRGSLSDLANYASVYAMGGLFGNQRMLEEHSVWRMRQPVIRTGRKTHYCYGLQTAPEYAKNTLVSHGGGLPGVSSHFGFVPEKGLSVAVLTNVAGVPAQAIWLAAVNTMLGLPLENRISEEPEWDAPEEILRAFVGEYVTAEGSSLSVSLAGKTLSVATRDQKFAAQASDPDHLVTESAGQQTVYRFFRRADGEIWAVLAGSRMLTRTRI